MKADQRRLGWLVMGFGFALAACAGPKPSPVVPSTTPHAPDGVNPFEGAHLYGNPDYAKTVEGLAIGMVCAVLGVWLAGRYQPWLPGMHALVLGIGVAIVAPIGDLFESFVKREAGAKDTGRVFGAHGGALDRLDAVLFAAVVGYYIWAAYV